MNIFKGILLGIFIVIIMSISFDTRGLFINLSYIFLGDPNYDNHPIASIWGYIINGVFLLGFFPFIFAMFEKYFRD